MARAALRRPRRRATVALVLLSFAHAVTAAARKPATEPEVRVPTVEVHAHTPSQNEPPTLPNDATNSPSQSTTLRPRPTGGTSVSLPELLQAAPSLHLRRQGHLGTPNQLSLRGLGPQHVQVVLNDQPLSNATLSPIDLSQFPLAAIEQVEVFRGAGPARFGAPLGGVIHLRTPRPGNQWRFDAQAGGGSFWDRRAHLSGGGPLPAHLLPNPLGSKPLGLWFFVGYQGTHGAFGYYDDRATLYTSDDDRNRQRQNARFDGLIGHATLIAPMQHAAGGVLELQMAGQFRQQGVPGRGAQVESAGSAGGSETRLQLRARDMTWQEGLLRAATGFDLLRSSRNFEDPGGTLQLLVERSDANVQTLSPHAQMQWQWHPTQRSSLAVRLTHERFKQSSGSPAVTQPSQSHSLTHERWTIGASISHHADLHSWLEWVPSLRLDAVRDNNNANTLRASPRLGIISRLPGGWELRASGGLMHRLPTLLERYGDGVNTVANLELKPESGWSVDGGMTWTMNTRLRVPLWFGRDSGPATQPSRPLTVQTELAGFHLHSHNLVALLQNGPNTLKAANLGQTQVWGIEAAAAARLPWAQTQLSYTHTRSQDVSERVGYHHRTTPGTPLHRLRASVGVGPRWLRLHYTLTHATSMFLDAANLRPMPARTLHDIGLRCQLGRRSGWQLHATVSNLTNQRSQRVPVRGAPGGTGIATVTDVLGYPIPGRAFFAALAWQSPSPQ